MSAGAGGISNSAGSLSRLTELFRQHGAERIYAKALSPNDNSKNQVYLGGDFSVLNIIPHSEVFTDVADAAGSKRDRAKASLNFYWINGQGKFPAPAAQLILYPRYPEVRMSGFLKGCSQAPKSVMTVRDHGRVLFLGVTNTGAVLGHAVDAHDPTAAEFYAQEWTRVGVFAEIPANPATGLDSRSVLLTELRRIHAQGWIRSQKLGLDGKKKEYSARNGGGYTLEAELGVTPNGYSEPDFMGWEIKQYGVTDFTNFRPKSAVTLMTPEPSGGMYRSDGVAAFLARFGYADRNGVEDRINFGGVYACNRAANHLTGLRLMLSGYDPVTGKITDMGGKLCLVATDGFEAATWSFTGMMAHWNRKHAQAAYIPSIFTSPPPKYAYGNRVLMCENTDFLLFLRAVADGDVYYDPAIKQEAASSTSGKIKRRSQFRIQHVQLERLYHQRETVVL
jgi:hypothetical protein